MNSILYSLRSGAERIALAALEVNVQCATAYPGTPATAIFEALKKHSSVTTDVCWSINEKVALEEAASGAMLGLRSMCVMKHYGLNVCSDFLGAISLADYLPGGLVVIVGDDPEGHASRSEQDSRHYGKLFGIPVLEPTINTNFVLLLEQAYCLSSNYQIPVLVRVTTRILETYSQTKQFVGNNTGEKRLPIKLGHKIFSSPAPVYHHLQQQKMVQIADSYETSAMNSIQCQGNKKWLVIAMGRCAVIVDELIKSSNFDIEVDLLNLVTILPFPAQWLAALCSGYKQVIVIEEGDDIVETELHAAFTVHRVTDTRIIGKRDGGVSGQNPHGVGEIKADILRQQLLALLGKPYRISKKSVISKIKINGNLCAGCPHSASLYILKQAKQLYQNKLSVVGDVGCYTMGVGSSGYDVLDTVMCMGASISLATGMQKHYQNYGLSQRMVAVIGDSTFFHAGIPALIQAKKRNLPLVVLILDNSIAAMTGGQNTITSDDVDILSLISGLGISVEQISPFQIPLATNVLMSALAEMILKVIIMKAPCQLYGNKQVSFFYQIDSSICIGNACRCFFSCQNDFCCPALSIEPLSVYEPHSMRAKIDRGTCNGCGACQSLCSFGAISKVQARKEDEY